MGNVASTVAWNKIFEQRPELLHLFEPGQERELEAAQRKHPRLATVIQKFGLPPRTVIQQSKGQDFDNKNRFEMINDNMLTLQHYQQFFSDGYAIVKGGVPTELCDAALRHINAAIGKGQGTSQNGPGGLVNLGNSRSPSLINLLDSSKGSKASTAIQCLLGRGRASLPPFGCQVALKFPTETVPFDGGRRAANNGRAWHIDGFQRGKHSPFTILVGVCLADQKEINSGELAVHPGAHWTLQSTIRDNVLAGSSDYLSPESPEGEGIGIGIRRPDLGQPKRLLLEKGDVVLCHQKLPHRGCQNFSANIRYQVYFRIKHVDLDLHRNQWLDDLMLPFEGARREIDNVCSD